MFLRAVHFAAWRSGVAALLVLSFAASAQQAIQFSRPANQDPAAPANSYAPSRHKSASDFNAPKSLFGDDGPSASFDVLPSGPAPAMPNAYTLQWQKLLQDRKNWALMTPEQVLGVPTPESILGIAPKEDPKLTLEARFLQRQDRQSEMAATNGLPRQGDTFLRSEDQNTGLFQDRNEPSQFTETKRGLNPDTTTPNTDKRLSSFLSRDSGNHADMDQPSDPTWASPFAAPPTPPQSTPEQLANMDRFRALIDMPSSEKAPATANLFLPHVAAPDPLLPVQPLYSPVGHSFTPVGNDITKPTGLTPLTGISAPPPVPAKKPALVQPPPWMSQSAQSTTLPQRQF